MKRALSIFLTCVFLLGLLPTAALAAEAYSGGLCPHHTEHTGDCGYVPATEGTPCGYVCEVCNTEDNGETATPSNAQNALTQLITAWEWVDEWEALSYDDGAAAWVLALPGASERNPAMREDIVSLLPESIIATLGEEQETISLCEQNRCPCPGQIQRPPCPADRCALQFHW